MEESNLLQEVRQFITSFVDFVGVFLLTVLLFILLEVLPGIGCFWPFLLLLLMTLWNA
jgi:hypothetical protein